MDEGLPDTEPGGEQPSDTEPVENPPEDDPPGDEPTEDNPAGDDPPDEENNPPVIGVVIADGVTVEIGDEVITDIGDSIIFEVQASDPDDDELLYTASDNLDNIMEVIKINNNHAQFGWEAPETFGNYDITIAVSDEEEAADTRVIPVNVIHAVGIIPEDYITDERTIAPDPALSGCMSESRIPSLASDGSGTPSIYVGDSTDGSNVKGYLSFNVNDLSGTIIIEAEVVITHFGRVGDPTSLHGSLLDFYAVNYGGSLDGSDYRTGSSTGLASMAPESTSFTISVSELIEEIQEVLDDPGRDNFQLKLFFQNANTNGDPDGFEIILSNVSLLITYYYPA